MKYQFLEDYNFRNISLLIALMILPNLLGMINLPTVLGFKIHVFQIAVFLAAMLFGSIGGMMSGLIGSIFSAIIMNNPYILIGNAILGFFVGYFFKKGFKIIPAIGLAFVIQIPWLVITDYFLIGLSITFITSLLVTLFISNTIWGLFAGYIYKNVRS